MNSNHITNKIKIAYITVEDPYDKSTWSGTNYFILKTLQDHVGEVAVLGPITPKFTLLVLKTINFITYNIFRKRFDYRHSIFLSKAYSRLITPKLNKNNYDVIISPSGSTLLAYLNTKIPVIYIGDRTIKAAHNYHKQISDLFDFSYKQSVTIDNLILNKASIISYPSYWAGNSAINDYNIDPKKVKVIPFGANLEQIPEITISKESKKEKLNLLFIGVNWVEKGGQIAFETLLELEKSGIKTKLTMCGCRVPKEISHPNLKIEGYLDKNDKNDYLKLINHFKNADFLILPTRFEAYGLVLCEAAAYGIPILATNTGGIPTIVKKGETGFLFPLEAKGKDYADKIKWITEQPDLLFQLKQNSLLRYKTILNWKTWASEINKVLTQLSI